LRRADQNRFGLSIAACKFEFANRYQSFGDRLCVVAANNRSCYRNDCDSRRGSQRYCFCDSSRFVAVRDRPTAHHARHGSSQTWRTSCPNPVRVRGHCLDHGLAPLTLPAAPTTERVQKISTSKTCVRVSPFSFAHLLLRNSFPKLF